MKKILIVIIALLFIMPFASENAGTAAGAFLKIGVGAKPSALGDAFIGLADDNNAILYNPSGIAFFEKASFSFTHLNWIADTTINAASVVYGLEGIGTFGLLWNGLNYGTLIGMDDEGNPTEDFTPTDNLIALAFARKINETMSAGLNLKYIFSTIQDYTASTVAFDLGFMYKTLIAERDLGIGLSIKNLGGKMKYDTEGDSLPMYFGLGFSYHILQSETNNITACLDMGKSSDTDMKYGMGVEYRFMDYVAIRLGYKAGDYDVEGFSGGLGAGYTMENGMRFSLDYAYGSTIEAFKDVHRITFNFSF